MMTLATKVTYTDWETYADGEGPIISDNEQYKIDRFGNGYAAYHLTVTNGRLHWAPIGEHPNIAGAKAIIDNHAD